MSEKRLVVNNLELNYKGIFSFEELYKEIGRIVEERGYKRHEKRYEEFVTPSGKELFVELRPMKKKTEYYDLMLKIRVEAKNVKESTVEVDGVPTVFQEGDVSMIFDAWTTTDYEHRWGEKPIFFFVKALINKWVYRFPMEEGFLGEVAADVRSVYRDVKAHLNLYKYKVRGKQAVEAGGGISFFIILFLTL